MPFSRQVVGSHRVKLIEILLLFTMMITLPCFGSSLRHLSLQSAQRSSSASLCKALSYTTKTRLFATTSSSSSFELAHRLDGLDMPTVWHEFSPLANQHGSINLGQGFPDWDPPAFCISSMLKSIDPAQGGAYRHANQYARSYAHMPLATVLANDYNERWQQPRKDGTPSNIPIINPESMIATGVGCTNVLFCALQGLLNPGDEVILLEPYFDIYSSQVRMAGGTPVFVPLRPSKATETPNKSRHRNANDVFTLDLDELQAAMTSKTKVVLINTPHNPTGKMFTRTELEGIAKIVLNHKQGPPITVICDEVYEHIVFDPEEDVDDDTDTIEHISMASISPEVFQQTLTLSSSGKTFSCTGWKVGWAIGPPHLVKAVYAVQQWVNFSVATPNQDAIAQALEIAKTQPYVDPKKSDLVYDNYYLYLKAEYQRKRQLLIDALDQEGVNMNPIVPPGGFFIMADTSNIDLPDAYRLESPTEASPKLTSTDGGTVMPHDWALCRWLTKEVGVTAIPPSAFYSPPNLPLAANFARFAFCKSDDTLREAHKRLQSYFGS